ncbi:MAG TPA: hypothetical protein VLW85_21285 [Myxococcales bacterium]|nr:hypothetical protein [Myxococcales bacterium]
MTLTGRCHCGNLSFELQTDLAEPPLRECQCSFCRMHASVSVSDPAGHLKFEVVDESLLSRYRFGLATADFLVCARCGAYAGALMTEGAQSWGIANARLLSRSLPQAAQAVSYEGETAAARIERRRQRWTRAEITIRPAAGAPRSLRTE